MGHSPQSLIFNWVRQQNERKKIKSFKKLLSLRNRSLIQYICIWVIILKIVAMLCHFWVHLRGHCTDKWRLSPKFTNTTIFKPSLSINFVKLYAGLACFVGPYPTLIINSIFPLQKLITCLKFQDARMSENEKLWNLAHSQLRYKSSLLVSKYLKNAPTAQYVNKSKSQYSSFLGDCFGWNL